MSSTPAPPLIAPSGRDQAIAQGYGLALHEFDAHAVELRRYMRGLTTAAEAQAQIDAARETLAKMEAALTGAA